ncbi:MAG: MFS transporter [Succinivibrio sp.]
MEKEQTLKLPKKGWLNIGIFSFGHFVSDYYCNLLPVMLPYLAVKFNFSYSMCGMLFMIFMVTASFLQAPIGIAADKRNLGFLLPLSIITSGVLACLIGICPSVVFLIVIVFFSGLCSSFFHPVAGGMVPSISPKGHEVLSTSLFIVGGNVGFAVAPFLTALYLEAFSPKELVYLGIIPVATYFVLIKRNLNTRPVSKEQAKAVSIKAIVTNVPFLLLVSSIGLRAVCYCSLVIYIPLLFTSKGISNVSASSILMVMLLGTAIGGLAVGGLSAKFKFKTLIVSSYALTVIMMAVFMLKADNSLLSYISIFFAGFGMYGATPPAIVWAQKMLPKADSFATSMMLGFTFGIGYVISVFIGMLGDYTGLSSALCVFIFPCLVIAILLVILIRSPKNCANFSR